MCIRDSCCVETHACMIYNASEQTQDVVIHICWYYRLHDLLTAYFAWAWINLSCLMSSLESWLLFIEWHNDPCFDPCLHLWALPSSLLCRNTCMHDLQCIRTNTGCCDTYMLILQAAWFINSLLCVGLDQPVMLDEQFRELVALYGMAQWSLFRSMFTSVGIAK